MQRKLHFEEPKRPRVYLHSQREKELPAEIPRQIAILEDEPVKNGDLLRARIALTQSSPLIPREISGSVRELISMAVAVLFTCKVPRHSFFRTRLRGTTAEN